MKIEKLKPNNDFFSDKDHFSKKTSTPIKKNEFELNRDEKCVNHIFGITVTSKFGGRFVKKDKKLKFLENIKPDTDFNE